MTDTPEPFIVQAGEERLNRLADVLIARSDGRPPQEQIAVLFGEYPGLALALILIEGRQVLLGTREGAIARLRLTSTAPVRLIAAAFYQDWLESSARMISARGEPNSS